MKVSIKWIQENAKMLAATMEEHHDYLPLFRQNDGLLAFENDEWGHDIEILPDGSIDYCCPVMGHLELLHAPQIVML